MTDFADMSVGREDRSIGAAVDTFRLFSFPDALRGDYACAGLRAPTSIAADAALPHFSYRKHARPHRRD